MGSTQIRALCQQNENKLDILPRQQPVAIDQSYNNQSANYHGQTSLCYMPNTRGMLDDYSTVWANQYRDLNGRPTEVFEERSSIMNEATYDFVLPSQGIATKMPQPIGAMTTTYTDADCVLSTLQSYRSWPQSNINLSTLPDVLSDINPVTHAKAWNSQCATSQDGTVPMAIQSSGLYNSVVEGDVRLPYAVVYSVPF
ncbi:hypothetical protein PENVUL_c125G09991 [Penicillium vulpinum]|uniref:Uncharacterized protein n=2 Tax=Penicillium vulpinum TaxID=29845 RepID=A0A1V6R0T2_9EURO|nr:hypothetical protein PENVUL_c125G09991 [Penicillium vulpinum]